MSTTIINGRTFIISIELSFLKSAREMFNRIPRFYITANVNEDTGKTRPFTFNTNNIAASI